MPSTSRACKTSCTSDNTTDSRLIESWGHHHWYVWLLSLQFLWLQWNELHFANPQRRRDENNHVWSSGNLTDHVPPLPPKRGSLAVRRPANTIPRCTNAHCTTDWQYRNNYHKDSWVPWFVKKDQRPLQGFGETDENRYRNSSSYTLFLQELRCREYNDFIYQIIGHTCCCWPLPPMSRKSSSTSFIP